MSKGVHLAYRPNAPFFMTSLTSVLLKSACCDRALCINCWGKPF